MIDAIATFESGLGSLIAIVAGVTALVATTELIARFLRAAAWQRVVWQMAIVGIATFCCLELAGVSTLLSSLARQQFLNLASTADSNVNELHPTEFHSTESQSAKSVSKDSHPAAVGILVEPTEPPQRRVNTGVASVQRPSAPIITGSNSPSRSVAPNVDDARILAPVGTSNWVFWLIVAWGALAIAGTGYVAWSRVGLWLYARNAARTGPANLQRRVEFLASRLSIAAPRFLELVELQTPIAFGIWTPTIAVPPRLVDDFDRDEVDTMIAHELGHLSGRDPLWMLLADLVCCALWWHPLVWWARRQLYVAGERSADEASLLIPGGPGLLAGCLVQFGKRVRREPRYAWLAVQGNGFRSGLGRRVQRLLALSNTSRPAPSCRRRLAGATVALVLLLFVVVTCTAWARPQAPLTEGDSTMDTLNQSWRRSLAAVAMFAFLAPVTGDVIAEEEGDRDRPAAERRGDGDRERERDGDRDRRRESGRDRDREREAQGEVAERLGQLRREHQKIEQHAKEIRGALERLGEDGGERRAALERELRKIHERAEQIRHEAQRLERSRHPERYRPDGEREGNELERRIRHLRAAAENLKAAGFHDEAHKLMEHGEAMIRQHREGQDREGDHRRAEHAPSSGEEVRHLREQVHHLREEMREMRHFLEEVAEELGDRDEEEDEDDDDEEDEDDDDEEEDEGDDDDDDDDDDEDGDDDR